jgi:hypothetical protein
MRNNYPAMKTLILFAILICLSILSAFGQKNSWVKADSTISYKLDLPDELLSLIDTSFLYKDPSIDSILNSFTFPSAQGFENFLNSFIRQQSLYFGQCPIL